MLSKAAVRASSAFLVTLHVNLNSNTGLNNAAVFANTVPKSIADVGLHDPSSPGVYVSQYTKESDNPGLKRKRLLPLIPTLGVAEARK